MTALQLNNINRAAYQIKYRKKLIEHLHKIYRLKERHKVLTIFLIFKLDFSIKLENVRLIINVDDLYL